MIGKIVRASIVAFVIAAPTFNAQGTELYFTLRVDAGAALGLRRLVLTAAGKPLAMSRPADGTFLISAPIPELAAVDPQILKTGAAAATFTAYGRNLTNVSAVRIEPAAGITVSGPFNASADGSSVTFNASAALGTVSGARTVIVTTAAGDSSPVQAAGNMIRVATQLGATYANIASAAVGVVIGSATPAPVTVDGTLASPVVGVMIPTTPVTSTVTGTVATPQVGVVVGAVAQTIAPTGWLQGASGTITVTGIGLSAVTTASTSPGTGILLGAPVASPDGSSLTMSIAVAPNAAQGLRELRLGIAGNGRLSFSRPETASFGIGSLPSISSVSPIVFEQGKGVNLVVRGSNLSGVTRVAFTPDSGVRAAAGFTWSQDALGDLLSVAVIIDAGAPQGARVVRLEVFGGSTSAYASPANTITVVVPQ